MVYQQVVVILLYQVIPSKASEEEKEAAWEFINWITKPEQVAQSTVTTGYVPTTKTATQTETIENLFIEKPQFKVALEQLESYGYGRPMNQEYSEVQKEMVNAMDAIWVNLQDIDSVLTKTQEKVDAIL